MTEHHLRVRPDKVASVCIPFKLHPYLSVRPEPLLQEGAAVVARVLSVSANYGALELVSGRPAQLVPGDIIVGVLGARAALRGFCGRIPKSIARGDTLGLLNKGGVIGEPEGWTVGLGEPSRVEVLGTPVRDGKPLVLSEHAIAKITSLPQQMPKVLVVAATCMSAGKSTAASVIIHHLSNSGLRVHAGKVTGVAAMADLLSFSDSGAQAILSFVDAGLPSTCYHNDVPDVARTVLGHLTTAHPDVIVLELGDGLLGAYGVDAILDDSELTRCFTAAIVAANDVIGGWCAAERLRERGINVAVITGPATDNAAGRTRLAELGYNAVNVFQQRADVCRAVRAALQLPESAA